MRDLRNSDSRQSRCNYLEKCHWGNKLLFIARSLIEHTAGTAGLSDVFSLPLVVALEPSINVLDVIASRLSSDSVPGTKGSRP